jgi:hypothetical protein
MTAAIVLAVGAVLAGLWGRRLWRAMGEWDDVL